MKIELTDRQVLTVFHALRHSRDTYIRFAAAADPASENHKSYRNFAEEAEALQQKFTLSTYV